MNLPATLRKPALATLAVVLGAAFLPAQAVAADEAQWVPGRLLVQPRAGLPEAEFEKIVKQHGGKQIGKIEGINVRVIQLPPQASEKAVEALLKRNKHLKFAERDMVIKPAGTANDKYFANAWHLAKTAVPTAWDVSTGANMVIAILDTGIDGAHPDLAGKLVPGWNFYNNNADTADVNGHGTAVGGAAVALTNNSIGVAAVARDAMLMPVRIADANAWATWSTVAQGLTWAADKGADVANISYNGVSGSSSVQTAAQYMKNKGGLVVVAAGNNSVQESIAPSSTMITVSATDSTDTKTSWSSYGSFVDVAAPGVNIYSTMKGGGYGLFQGTSLASPIAAGVVALIKAANPALSPSDVEKVLFSTAADLGAAGFDSYYGNGRVDAHAAVKAASSATTQDTTAPGVSFSSPTTGSTVKGLASVNVNASDNVGVSKVELRANGVLVASDISSPYAFSWDSGTVADGSVTLSARAYDAAGNYSTSSVAVTVANAVDANTGITEAKTADTVAPVAVITSPKDGAQVSGNVTVSAAATDNVSVSRITLFIDGKAVAAANAASLSYRWNARKEASGTHVLRVDAVDTAGNVGSRTMQVVK